MESSIIALSLLIALISVGLDFGPSARTLREEKQQQQQRVKLRNEFQVKIEMLTHDEIQRSEIRLVIAYFENEDFLKIEHVDSSLVCLREKGVRGPDFRELFLFLHENLRQKGRNAEADYLYLQTCV